jgi:hypothetical protein
MDEERERDEEPVEDLDPPEEDAENVRGGYTYLKIEGIRDATPPPPPPRP